MKEYNKTRVHLLERIYLKYLPGYKQIKSWSLKIFRPNFSGYFGWRIKRTPTSKGISGRVTLRRYSRKLDVQKLLANFSITVVKTSRLVSAISDYDNKFGVGSSKWWNDLCTWKILPTTKPCPGRALYRLNFARNSSGAELRKMPTGFLCSNRLFFGVSDFSLD